MMNLEDIANIQKRHSRRLAWKPGIRRRAQKRAMERIYQSNSGQLWLAEMRKKFKDADKMHEALFARIQTGS